MSVKKFIVGSKKISFTSIPNKVLQGIQDVQALGLFVYLASLPPSWEFYKESIRDHFGIGIHRLNELFKKLEGYNLVNLTQVRNDKGRFTHTVIDIDDGTSFKINELTPCYKNRNTVTVIRSSATINKTYKNKTKINNTKRAPRKKRAPLSDDFIFDNPTLQMLKDVSHKVNVGEPFVLNKFKLLCKSQGKQSADWNAEFQKFLMNERPMVHAKPKKEEPAPRSAVNRMPEYVSQKNIRQQGSCDETRSSNAGSGVR